MMRFAYLHIITVIQRPGHLTYQIEQQIHRQTHIRADQYCRILTHFGKFRSLHFRQPRRAHYQRYFLNPAVLSQRHRRVRPRKIDHHIALAHRPGRHLHPQLTQPGDHPNVSPNLRMPLAFHRPGHFKPVRFLRQCHDPLTHPPSRTVDR